MSLVLSEQFRRQSQFFFRLITVFIGGLPWVLCLPKTEQYPNTVQTV